MLFSSMRMSPLLRLIMRLTSRIAVVFPHPDGPTSTHTSPAGTVNDRSSIAAPWVPEYRLLTLRNSNGAALESATATGLDCAWSLGPVLPRHSRAADRSS